MHQRPHYSISTPENVDLHLELAGLGSRVWAAFIDTVIVYLGIIFVVFMAAIALGVISNMDMVADARNLTYYYVVGIAIFLVFSIQFGYFILFEKLWKGQTPGKKVAEIRVVEANGQPVNWSSVTIRNLVRIVDFGFLMVGLVVMIFDPNERRLGDLLGGTLVIRERKPELSARSLRITAELPATSFVDAGQLSLDEYHLLVSFLRRRHQMAASNRSKLGKQLEEYYRRKLNPENKGESPEFFLEKVYLSYSDQAAVEGKS